MKAWDQDKNFKYLFGENLRKRWIKRTPESRPEFLPVLIKNYSKQSSYHCVFNIVVCLPNKYLHFHVYLYLNFRYNKKILSPDNTMLLCLASFSHQRIFYIRANFVFGGRGLSIIILKVREMCHKMLLYHLGINLFIAIAKKSGNRKSLCPSSILDSG